jgi:hypothetical protein
MTPELGYDRRAPELLALLDDAGGLLTALLARCGQELVDLQVRRDSFGERSWVSIYVGLTTVLDIALSADRFRVSAHRTHRSSGGFDPAWLEPMTLPELAEIREGLCGYLDRVIPTVGARHTAKEGRVHTALCSGASDAYSVADREAAVGFRNSTVKGRICDPIADAIHTAVLAAGRNEPWWPGNGKPPRAFGTGLDVLAVDPAGRLLVIEAKPSASLEGIMWGPAQVRFYAEVFARWAHDTDDATAIIDGLTAQRRDLGLSPTAYPISDPPVVVPVLAIGDGPISPQALPRADAIRDVVDTLPAGPGVTPVEIWRLDETGHPTSHR